MDIFTPWWIYCTNKLYLLSGASVPSPSPPVAPLPLPPLPPGLSSGKRCRALRRHSDANSREATGTTADSELLGRKIQIAGCYNQFTISPVQPSELPCKIHMKLKTQQRQGQNNYGQKRLLYKELFFSLVTKGMKL